MTSLLNTDSQLRAEATDLLQRLRPILEPYAPLHPVGSYVLELMAWRDLDLLLDAPGIVAHDFFELGWRIMAALHPWKMFFTNNRTLEDPSSPRGLYWGIRMGDIKKGAWKIDLWAFETDQAREKIRQCEDLKRRLNPQNRLTILDLKSQLWKDPRYRDQVTSQDIYDAVLDHGVQSLEEFWQRRERNA